MFKVDFTPEARAWYYSDGKLENRVEDYQASFYIHGRDLQKIRMKAVEMENVVATCFENHRLRLRGEKRKVLRIDVRDVHRLKKTARQLRKRFAPGRYRFFDVDLTPQFRYCLDRQVEPGTRNLSEMSIEIPRRHLMKDRLEKTVVDDEELGQDPVEKLNTRLRTEDPDILHIPSSRLLSAFRSRSEKKGRELRFGRTDGFRKLAGENNYESFGKVGFSPARYNVPGRIVIDKSNSFFTGKTGIAGMKYLSQKSWKPLQEVSWASIGNILTSIETREARRRDVLIPWNKWQVERFKELETLHASDRGGFIFSPEPGVYRDVEEADFSSLYPNIMVEKNISPDSLLCKCCENSRVPELNYNVCERKGFLADVLKPLIDDRARMKKQIAEDHPDSERLESESDAIKWILVSCFGYQGYRNAKFGRIECHEAINAHAREIMLDAKERFEQDGWKVIHGIIDSIWVQKPDTGAGEMKKICREVSESTEIELEYENSYDWIAFVPRKNTGGGALNRYFGRKKDGSYKFRGIELRQDSVPGYIKQVQRDMVEEFPDTGRMTEVLRKSLEEIGEVDREKLLVRKNVSREPENYSQYTRTVAALERYRKRGMDVSPGEKVEFYVHNDSLRNADRVRLRFEQDSVDRAFYRKQIVSSAVSIMSPLGWKRDDILKRINGSRTALTDYS